MHKQFKWLIAIMITVFTLPMMGSAVFADGTNQLKDGTYDIDYTVVYEGEGDAPDVDKYFNKPATLTVEDGTQHIQFKYTATNFILSINVPNGEVTTVEEDKDKKTKVVDIKTDADLSESMKMGMEMSYGMTHNVKVNFDVSDVPTQSDNADSGEENGSGNTKEGIVNEQGNYTFDFDALQAEEDKASAMASYMADSAFVSVQDNQVELTLALADKTVTDLQINGEEAINEKVDGDTRYETFKLNNLPSVLNDAHVAYQAPYKGEIFKSEADFRISFDEGSQKAKDADDKMTFAADFEAPELDQGSDDNNSNSDKEDKPDKGNGNDNGSEDNTNQNNDDKNNEDKNSKGNNETTDPETEADPSAFDEAYQYDYVVKHATKDETSAADRFFKKPATVLHKGDNTYIQLEVTNWEWIKSLSNNGKNVTVVEETEEGSAVVQFKVNGNLSEAITMDMHVEVPKEVAGMAYDMDHSARLFLDMDSQTDVNTDNYELAVSQGSQNSGGDGDANNGSNTSKTDDTDNGEVTNPQTGESSNIWLNALMLIGSMIPLAIKLKRRFV